MTKTKTIEEMEGFKNCLENALMELWAHGQAGATKVHVANIGWTVSLALTPRWVVTLGNVDRKTEPALMQNLNLLVRQTEYGKEDMDVYSEWADEQGA
jgi:hypothetical protein